MTLTPNTTGWNGGAYSIKRHGVTISNCDTEPVQTPGCVQAHGGLLVLRENDLTVLQASENIFEYLGYTPEELLGHSVAKALGVEREGQLRAILKGKPVEENPLYVFTMSGRAETRPLDAFIHTVNGLAVLELEESDRGESNPDYYALIKQSVRRLEGAPTLKEFYRIVTEEVRALTDLDRVMVYRFHEDFHGEVVGESKREGLPGWLGMHYPAEDIPEPAREIFKKIWIRPLPDAKAPVMELVPLLNPDTGKPLTMTYCTLRGASVMYTEYLQNMGVAASLTMAIRRDGELWGLIACHHDKPTQFPYQVRAACEFLAQVVSLQLTGAEQREAMVYRLHLEGVHDQLIAEAAKDEGLALMAGESPNLLDGLDAGGAALYEAKRWWRMGRTPTERQLDDLKRWLDTRSKTPSRQIYATDALVREYPEAAEFAEVASGILAMSIVPKQEHVIFWFRPQTVQTVTWAGNPNEKPTVVGPHGPRLTPRKSFERFIQSVRKRALPWKNVEIEAAGRLQQLLMELVAGRSRQLIQMNAALKQSNEELDAFAYIAGHDLKEPLRGISKYAHQVLESAPEKDEGNRKRLEALIRLTLGMDGLIDSLLHFSRVGRTEVELEKVDLNLLLKEALEILAVRLQEKPTDILVPRPLTTVDCDRVRVREVFTNLVTNALKYNDKPGRSVEIGYVAPGEPGERGSAPQECLSETIFYVRDNGIGIDSRSFATVFKIFRRLHGREEFGGGSGVGLTIVQKLVTQHQGCVWLDSAIGAGTTVYFTLSGAKHEEKNRLAARKRKRGDEDR